MHRSLIAVLIFAVLFVGVRASETEVVVLTAENFDAETSGQRWLIDFFAPWCPHCQKLAPEFDTASILAAQLEMQLKFATVDCTIETTLCERFEIKGFPTIKYVRMGAISDYQGGRSSADFMDFAKRVTGPAITAIETREKLAEFAEKPVFYFAYRSTREYVMTAARYQDSMNFASTINLDLMKQYLPHVKLEDDGNYFIVVNDGEVTQYTGEMDIETFSAWVEKMRVPRFANLEEYWGEVVNKGLPVVVAVHGGISTESAAYLTTMKGVSKLRSDYTFSFLDGSRHPRFVTNFGVEADAVPTFFVYDGETNNYYIENVGKTAAEINQFLDDLKAGKVAPRSATPSFMDQLKMYATNPAYVMALIAVILILGGVIYMAMTSKPDDNELLEKKDGEAEKTEEKDAKVEKKTTKAD